MITVIYHSADFDGIFCREIAKRFLGEKDVQYIGWNFGDRPVDIPREGPIYIMDLPPDKPWGLNGPVVEYRTWWQNIAGFGRELIWIDHHKSSIESQATDIPGYRIDGVAACRLAWQWFTIVDGNAKRKDAEIGIPIRPAGVLPMVQDYKNREVNEPLAVRLAGEYDVWDKNWMEKEPRILRFQYGLRTLPDNTHDFAFMLRKETSEGFVGKILEIGKTCQDYQQNMDRVWLGEAGHIIQWEGLKFLAKNTVERGSNMFLSKDNPGTGHDALLAYGFRGKVWTVSLYHAKHRTDLDLSTIAVKHGGGGHRGACGFTCKKLPFME